VNLGCALVHTLDGCFLDSLAAVEAAFFFSPAEAFFFSPAEAFPAAALAAAAFSFSEVAEAFSAAAVPAEAFFFPAAAAVFFF